MPKILIREKTTITQSERLQVMGLLVLAEQHNRALVAITKATAEILGEPLDDNYAGHVSDVIWDFGSKDADDLISRLEITVETT